MRASVAALVFIALYPSAIAGAQSLPDFSGLRLKNGEKVYVTDTSTGVEISGPLERISTTELSIDGHAFHPEPQLKIERAGDPVWDGAAIGFGVGTVLGAINGAEACLHRPLWPCLVGSAAEFAVIGTVIDWLHKGRTTVYDPSSGRHGRSAVRMGPTISTHEKGVALSMSF